MYVLFEKEEERVSIFKDMAQVADYLGIHRTTVSRNLKENDGKYWKHKRFSLFLADYVQTKSNRGGLRTPKYDV